MTTEKANNWTIAGVIVVVLGMLATCATGIWMGGEAYSALMNKLGDHDALLAKIEVQVASGFKSNRTSIDQLSRTILSVRGTQMTKKDHDAFVFYANKLLQSKWPDGSVRLPYESEYPMEDMDPYASPQPAQDQ